MREAVRVTAIVKCSVPHFADEQSQRKKRKNGNVFYTHKTFDGIQEPSRPSLFHTFQHKNMHCQLENRLIERQKRRHSSVYEWQPIWGLCQIQTREIKKMRTNTTEKRIQLLSGGNSIWVCFQEKSVDNRRRRCCCCYLLIWLDFQSLLKFSGARSCQKSTIKFSQSSDWHVAWKKSQSGIAVWKIL